VAIAGRRLRELRDPGRKSIEVFLSSQRRTLVVLARSETWEVSVARLWQGDEVHSELDVRRPLFGNDAATTVPMSNCTTKPGK